MHLRRAFVLSILASLTLSPLGCDPPGGDPATSGTPGKSKKKKRASDDESSEAEGAKSKKKASEDGPGRLGIAPCDEYLTNYPKCFAAMEGLSAELVAQQKKAFAKTKEDWVKSAQNPATRASLKNNCKKILEATRDSMQEYCPGVWDD